MKPQHEAFRQRTMKKTVIIDTTLNTARLFTVHICNSQISQKYQLKISHYFTCISSSRNLNLELFSSATCTSHLLWAGAHRFHSKLQVAIQQSFIASGSYAATWKVVFYLLAGEFSATSVSWAGSPHSLPAANSYRSDSVRPGSSWRMKMVETS